MNNNTITRQKFLQQTVMAGAAVMLSSLESFAITKADKKLRVAVIGCGSVSNRYLPQLQSSKLIEIVSLCDIKYERAVTQNKQYNVKAKTYPHIDAPRPWRKYAVTLLCGWVLVPCCSKLYISA